MKTKEKTKTKEQDLRNAPRVHPTSGPWDVSRWGKCGFEIQGGGKSLAIVNKVQETRNTFLEADGCARQRRNESNIEEPNYSDVEALANARVMAAAPDLLKVLRKAVLTASHDQECPQFGFDTNPDDKCKCWYQPAWNAINKADGKE